jgi:hypothetical protein
MQENKTIYIKLLNEGVDVWRPTKGILVKEHIYKLLPTADYDPNQETWEYLPGSIVRCGIQKHKNNENIFEEMLVAVAQAE